MNINLLTPQEVRDWLPYPLPEDGLTPLRRTRERLARAGQWAPWQMLGRRFPIGCVALEITQRCNLDCSYCYLSESSEALKDIPLEEIFRRIDLIHAHYGDHADIQITGGEPTLRSREDLLAIVSHIRARRMRSSLFTNGIRASRDLLTALCAAGLEDVAFHVDLTQERAGFRSEAELNPVREEYIERARGLKLSVIFNTTVFPGNFDQMPDLVRFFLRHCDVVRMAAFQAGADSGRGVMRARAAIDPQTIQGQIEQATGVPLDFGAASCGHASCNRYACALVVNGRVHDLFLDAPLAQEFFDRSAHLTFGRADKVRVIAGVARFLAARPLLLARAIARLAGFVWAARRDLIAARGRVGKLSFHIHNFQDAKQLERARCEACSFMVMTPDGPLSMCVHNAKRDDYLLVPARVKTEGVIKFWNPATGQLQDQRPGKIEVRLTRKNSRGRAKAGAGVETAGA